MIILENQIVGMKVESELRRGKSFFAALAVTAMEAHDRQERTKKEITGVWIDDQLPRPTPKQSSDVG